MNIIESLKTLPAKIAGAYNAGFHRIDSFKSRVKNATATAFQQVGSLFSFSSKKENAYGKSLDLESTLSTKEESIEKAPATKIQKFIAGTKAFSKVAAKVMVAILGTAFSPLFILSKITYAATSGKIPQPSFSVDPVEDSEEINGSNLPANDAFAEHPQDADL